MMRWIAALCLAASLTGCAGFTPGTYFSIGMDVGFGIANANVLEMTDEELLEHRELVVDMIAIVHRLDQAMQVHLAATDNEIARRGLGGPPE